MLLLFVNFKFDVAVVVAAAVVVVFVVCYVFVVALLAGVADVVRVVAVVVVVGVVFVVVCHTAAACARVHFVDKKRAKSHQFGRIYKNRPWFLDFLGLNTLLLYYAFPLLLLSCLAVLPYRLTAVAAAVDASRVFGR